MMPCVPCRSLRSRSLSSRCVTVWLRCCWTQSSWSWRSLRRLGCGSEPSAPRWTDGRQLTWTTSSPLWTGWRSACSVQSQTWRTSEKPWQRSERSASVWLAVTHHMLADSFIHSQLERLPHWLISTPKDELFSLHNDHFFESNVHSYECIKFYIHLQIWT